MRLPLLIGLLLAAMGCAASPALADPCEGAGRLAGDDVRIVRATAVGPEAPFVAPYPGALPQTERFCRVEGFIEKEIGFELWFPARERWNARLLVGGVGGQAGSFNYRELERGVRRGYASASTDTGHKADDRHWLLRRPDRAANYAYRANHLLAVRAKAMVRAFYGAPARNAFFVGCSGGGRQALTEVQRFPGDFDAVIAGAPGVNTPEMSARRMWEMQQHSLWARLMTAADWKLVAQAAVRACDELDGVRDGVIDDPRRCRFNPGTLACATGMKAGCLSAAQIAAVRRIYAPLVDAHGGWMTACYPERWCRRRCFRSRLRRGLRTWRWRCSATASMAIPIGIRVASASRAILRRSTA
jgi:feruloyl esterase